MTPRSRAVVTAAVRSETPSFLYMEQVGHAAESRKAYEEALRIEPGFLWVKGQLLPGLERGVQPFPEVP